MTESAVATMNRILREAMPAERLKSMIVECEAGLGKFEQWMDEMPADERQRLIASVLADEKFASLDDGRDEKHGC